jgi:hypothetical protein
VRHALNVAFQQPGMGTDTGVVHQQADAGVFAQFAFYLGQVIGVGQVCREHFHVLPGFGGKPTSQCVEALPVACHQHQVIAATGQLLCVDRTDTG